MARIGLAVLVVLLLAAGQSNALAPCGFLGGQCCIAVSACNPGLVCDTNNPTGCLPALVWLGGGNGGAAGDINVVCPGTCVQPSATPTHTPTNTPINTPTHTPTNTPINTPTHTPTNSPKPMVTPTSTQTPHGLADDQACTDSRQCTSALCNGGVCAKRNAAPAVSSHTAVFIGAALLLAGLWSVRRVERRR
jgi:hypothetical protein